MRSRRILVWALAGGLCLTLGASVVQAQTTGGGGTTGGGTTGGGTTTGGGGGTTGAGTTTGGGTTMGGGGSTSSSNQAQDRVKVPSFTATKITILTPKSGTGSATGTPSTSNSFVSSYGDPLSIGMPSKYVDGPPTVSTVTFGKGMYSTTITTNQGTGGNKTAASTTAVGFTTVGVARSPQYATVLSDELPIVVHQPSILQGTVKAVIDRSSILKSKGTIEVAINGTAIELRGQVANEKERLVAERLVRMTPGVRNVNNVLTVQAK